MTFVPMLQMVLLGIAIGKEPQDLKLGVVDLELMSKNPMNDYTCHFGNGTCLLDDEYVGLLGCQFVAMLRNDFQNSIDVVKLIYAYEFVAVDLSINFLGFLGRFIMKMKRMQSLML